MIHRRTTFILDSCSTFEQGWVQRGGTILKHTEALTFMISALEVFQKSSNKNTARSEEFEMLVWKRQAAFQIFRYVVSMPGAPFPSNALAVANSRASHADVQLFT